MDTFLVRTLLVPSTVVLLGRWNWWPSRMSRVNAERAWPDSPEETTISPEPDLEPQGGADQGAAGQGAVLPPDQAAQPGPQH